MTKRRDVKKPDLVVRTGRPWGLIAVTGTLVLALGGILVYAVLNTGSDSAVAAQQELLAKPKIEGVTPFVQQSGEHSESIDSVLEYPQYPPLGGRHAPRWQNCGTYSEPVRTGTAVHSMEHGAVWISYRPDLPVEDIQTLFDTSDRDPYVLVAPAAEEQKAPVVLTAWGLQLLVDDVEDERIEEFIETYTNGPQTPEKGALCSAGVGSGE